MTNKERKPVDYSASAINLVNPPAVGLRLADLHQAQAEAKELESDLQKNETYILLQDKLRLTKTIEAQIKSLVDDLGSYQNLETGDYALKQRRVSKSYNAQSFKKDFEKFAPVVIEESVNVVALNGLIKGGFISEADLKAMGITEETISFDYIVR